MSVSRRALLITGGVGAAGAAGLHALREGNVLAESRSPAVDGEWVEVRKQFALDAEWTHLAGLLLAAHPEPVRQAITHHRQELDRNPATYVQSNNRRLENAVREAAGRYLGARGEDVAITNSTTEGVGLVCNGVEVSTGQELLTSRWDYYSTKESLKYKARRTGARYREIQPYGNIHSVTADELADRLLAAVTDRTRVVAVTWVHSSTGLKVPVRQIADRLAQVNRNRDPDDRALLFVDGVHGLGVENVAIPDLGGDFFMAGTHKWMFAPRGTGIIWGDPRWHTLVRPTVPTFSGASTWGALMTPGGFNAFEHRWAMTEAFDFHLGMGKARVQSRIHSLARQLKEGLRDMPHIRLYTPMAEELSSGIVCFDVNGLSPSAVVSRLREQRIVASTTPYSPSYARLTPGVYNTGEEMKATLRAIAAMG